MLSTVWAGGAAGELGEGAITDRYIRATAIRGRLGVGIARNDRRGMVSALSSASGGSGPGALCVNMYAFAGVTASEGEETAAETGVSRSKPFGVRPNGSEPRRKTGAAEDFATPV